jgi:hypothetical protein
MQSGGIRQLAIEPYGVRAEGWMSLSACQRNWQFCQELSSIAASGKDRRCTTMIELNEEPTIAIVNVARPLTLRRRTMTWWRSNTCTASGLPFDLKGRDQNGAQEREQREQYPNISDTISSESWIEFVDLFTRLVANRNRIRFFKGN